MKKALLTCLLMLAGACVARGQTTAVTATVVDPAGNVYQNCQASVSFVPAPTATTQPLINGSTFQTVMPVAQCDSFGRFALTLIDNNQVSDGHTGAASQWNFQIRSANVCFAGQTVSFSVPLTITGASQDVSASLKAAAATLPLCGGGGGGGGSPIRINGTTVLNPNFNSATPSPDLNNTATTFVVSGSNVLAEVSNSITGPIPWRDATSSAYGAVSSTQTFTATTNAASKTVTINAAGDWQNGQAISIEGAGPLATVTAPTFASIPFIGTVSRSGDNTFAFVTSVLGSGLHAGQVITVTGNSDSTFNGIFVITQTDTILNRIVWIQVLPDATTTGGSAVIGAAKYQGSNPGATTYTYSVCTVGTGGGCSAKSADLTLTNGPATLTELDYNYLYLGNAYLGGATGMPLGGRYMCVYRNSSFIGRAHVPGFKDDGTVWARNTNCPATPPATPTADTLTTTIDSGAGTTTLTVHAAATTAGSGLFTFHDIAPALNAAAAAVATDPSGGKPNVILPSGNYYCGFCDIASFRLDATGAINLTTHPIYVEGGGTLQGHGARLTDGVNYNEDGMATIFSGNMDGVAISGGPGGNTVRGLSFANTVTHDLMFLADSSAGANGLMVENITGTHYTAGDCLWSESNVIFVITHNWRCKAANIAAGASRNRYSFYLSNVWALGSWVVWNMYDTFTDFGDVYIDSPAPTVISGSTSQLREFNIHGWDSEGTYSKGLFTVDEGCQQAPADLNQFNFSFPHFENVDPSDLNLGLDSHNNPINQAVFYYPRVGTTGCTTARISAGNAILVNVTNSPVIGAAISQFESNPTVSLKATNSIGDTGLGGTETSIGPQSTVIGGTFFCNYRNGSGVDVTGCAYLMATPTYFTGDNGAGATSCTTGTPYYFQLSASDGVGFTKIDNLTPEVKGTVSVNGDYMGIFYGLPFNAQALAAKKYRLWFSTTQGGENQYVEFTPNGTGLYNFTCAAGTVVAPPLFTTAYWQKWPSRDGDPGWIGISSTDLLGIGKTNPAYLLDVAGLINTDKALVLQETTAPAGISSADICWGDSTLHGLKCNNNSGGAVNVTMVTGAITGGHCAQFVDAHTIQDNGGACGSGGTGTVTSFSSGALATASQNLFTTSVATSSTTPAQTFTLVNAPAHTIFSNTSGSAGAPDYNLLTAAMEPSTTVNSVVNDTNVTGSIAAQVLTLGWTGSLAAGRGGTGQTTYTKGDTICPSAATTITKLGVGTNGQVLTANSAATCGINWATPGTGLTLDTNSVGNTSQTLLNFTNTSGATGINFTNPSGGVESAAIANTDGGGNSVTTSTLTGFAQGDTLCGDATPKFVNCRPGIVPNVQVGTTYTVAGSDRAGMIFCREAAAPLAITLPQAGTGVFLSNFAFAIKNDGTYPCTITPTTSTINGNASITYLPGQQGNVLIDNTGAQYLATISGYASGTTGSIGGAIVGVGCDTGTVTIQGAATSMVPVAAASTSGAPGAGFSIFAQVTGANTVTVSVCAPVSLTPTSSTYLVKLFP